MSAALLAGFFLAVSPATLPAQDLEVQPLRLYHRNLAIGYDYETREEDRQSLTDNFAEQREETVSTLVFDAMVSGSVYHPNFLAFVLSGEFGLEDSNEALVSTDPAAQEQYGDIDTDSALRQFGATVSLLRRKCFPVSLMARRSIDRIDRDFFTRVTTKTDTYRLFGRINNVHWPVEFSATRSEGDIDDEDYPENRRTDLVDVSTENRRARAQYTQARYSLERYRYEEADLPINKGAKHRVEMDDRRQFGQDDRVNCFSRLDFWSHDESRQEFNNLSVSELVTVGHRPGLSSDYHYSASGRVHEDAENMTHSLGAGLTHQLYESLTSKFHAGGEWSSNLGSGSEEDQRRFDLELGEDYRKRLRSWGHLSLDTRLGYRQEERASTGETIPIVDESIVLTEGATLLNRPTAETRAIFVTDSSGTVRYQNGTDYRVQDLGDSVQISRIVGGRIPEGATVLVDYSAATEPDDTFSTLWSDTSIRLDVMDSLLEFYARHHASEHDGLQSITIREGSVYTFGARLKTSWLGAGIEQRIDDQSISPYNSLLYYASLQYELVKRCTTSVEYRFNDTSYDDNTIGSESQSVIARLEVRPLRSLNLRLQAGTREEESLNDRRELMTVRGALSFKMGKLRIRAGAEREETETLEETFDEDVFFVRAERKF